MNKATLGLISIVLLAACGGRDGSPTVRLEVDAAPAVTAPVEVEAVTPALPETVEAKISAIRDVLARDSLSRLVRLADAEESFVGPAPADTPSADEISYVGPAPQVAAPPAAICSTALASRPPWRPRASVRRRICVRTFTVSARSTPRPTSPSPRCTCMRCTTACLRGWDRALRWGGCVSE